MKLKLNLGNLNRGAESWKTALNKLYDNAKNLKDFGVFLKEKSQKLVKGSYVYGTYDNGTFVGKIKDDPVTRVFWLMGVSGVSGLSNFFLNIEKKDMQRDLAEKQAEIFAMNKQLGTPYKLMRPFSIQTTNLETMLHSATKISTSWLMA